MLAMNPVTLRLATSSDSDALQRLAELDSRKLPTGPHLVAERGGRLDAAISLSSGAVVANPFEPTAELCELLRHAASIRRRRRATRPRRRIRMRPVPASA
jgi:hypothetical protein